MECPRSGRTGGPNTAATKRLATRGKSVPTLHVVTDGTDIELRNYWYTVRTPKIVVGTVSAGLRLPVYFGGAAWQVPLAEIGVFTGTEDDEQQAQSDVEFEATITLPYFFTTSPVSTPNLLLLFRHPQRVPPLTAIAAFAPNVELPFGYFSTRSSRGDEVDGVLLRCVDPADAASRLAAAGAESIADPVDWMAKHRKTVSDPLSLQQVAKRDQQVRRLENAGAVCAWGGLGLMALAAWGVAGRTFSVILGGLAILGWFAAWQFRRSARARQRRDLNES
jgi:hypothetical protein